MEVRVGDVYAVAETMMNVGKQEMDLVSAEKIASFTEEFIKVMLPLDDKRNTLLRAEYENEAEKMAAFDEFAGEKVKLPEFSFKEFSFLRISPDGIIALKRAGLYT